MIKLTEQKFAEIYSDEKLRNSVAYAHACTTRGGLHKYFKAVRCYPEEYEVTQDQKDLALKEVERARAERINNYKPGELIFVTMGMDFTEKDESLGDIRNHRIRSEFKNKDGKQYFVEFSCNSNHPSRFYCIHAVDRDSEELHKAETAKAIKIRNSIDRYSEAYVRANKDVEKWSKQPYYNYKNLERRSFDLPFTKENVLKLINEEFNCSYEKLTLDRYTLRTEDIICKC